MGSQTTVSLGNQMAMKPKISLIALGVRNVDRATAFYERLG
ncbi:MAG: hypothetical protein ACON36_10455 [Ilumatobacteraceae bacterium]